MPEREYEIVLFGATGFTGELTAHYLAGAMPDGARWAIAGRSRDRLEGVRARLPKEASAPELVLADSTDPDSIKELAESARVVASTVGPYLHHGEPLVAACAVAGTDYLDLCGEPEFVDLMYLRHHRDAAETGARLVHSCGFDSIPYDLGALWTVAQLGGHRPIRLQGFGQMGGRISGGTFHSAMEILGRVKESGRIGRQRRSVEENASDGGITPGRVVHGVSGKLHREPEAGGWVVPALTIDPQTVLRSARAMPIYGPEFTYSHYLVTRSAPRTAAFVGGVGTLMFLAQLQATRQLVAKLKSSGDGPSKERRAKSFFRVRFVADVAAERGGEGKAQRLITEVRGGDPGYGETSKMLSEAALSLAFDEGLPSASRGGQLTPAVAFGLRLVDRLTAAGIEFRTVD